MERTHTVIGIALSLTLTACGGGGGGSSTSAEAAMVYVGEQAPAVLSARNYRDFRDAVIDGPLDLSGLSESKSLSPSSSVSVAAATQLPRVLFNQLRDRDPRAGAAAKAVRVDERVPCSGGGEMHLRGSLHDSGTGSVSLEYIDCRIDQQTLNGPGRYVVHAADAQGGPLDSSLVFSGVSSRISGGPHERLHGEAREQTVSPGPLWTVNVLMDPVGAGPQRWYANFQQQQHWDSYPPQTELSGRVYLSDQGYVQVQTPQRLSESLVGGLQGEVLLTGFANSRLQMRLYGPAQDYQIDEDGDGVYEQFGHYLRPPEGVVLPPLPPEPAVSMSRSGADGLSVGQPVLFEATPLLLREQIVRLQWSVIEEPAPGAAQLDTSNPRQVTLIGTLPGRYTLGVVAENAEGLRSRVAQQSAVYLNIEMRSGELLDAVYSDALDQLIVLQQAAQTELLIIDAADQARSLVLDDVPRALLLGPDQRHLALQFDQHLQWLALDADGGAPNLLAEHPLEPDAGRSLITSGGWFHYLKDRANTWSDAYSLNLSSGEVRSGDFVALRGALIQGESPDHLLLFGPSEIRELHFADDGLRLARESTRSISGCANGWPLGAAARYTNDCGHVYALPATSPYEVVSRVIEEGLPLLTYTPPAPYSGPARRRITALHEQRALSQLLAVEQAQALHCDAQAMADHCLPKVTLPRNRFRVGLISELPVGAIPLQGQNQLLHARHAFTRGNGQVLILSQLPGNPGSWYLTRQ